MTSRATTIRRVLALLDRAGPTAEGRSAQALADTLCRKHRITPADVARARRDAEEADATCADLLGWSAPWLVCLAVLVAETSGLRTSLVGDNLTILGRGAGRAARRCRWLRETIEARVAAMERAVTIHDIVGYHGRGDFGFAFPSARAPTFYETNRRGKDVTRIVLALAYLGQPKPSPAPSGGPPGAAGEPDPAAHAMLAAASRIAAEANAVFRQRPAWAAPPTTSTDLVLA